MKTAQAHNAQITGHASVTLDPEEEPHVCPKCDGEKALRREATTCPTCNGTGVVFSRRNVRKDIVQL